MDNVLSTSAILLVFLIIAAPAYATGAIIYGGSNNVISSFGGQNSIASSPDGTVSGGEFINYETTDTSATLTAGVQAYASLTGTARGIAFSNWRAKNMVTRTHKSANGDVFQLQIGYDGNVKASVIKTSDDGERSCHADISSYASVDDLHNRFQGFSQIYSIVYSPFTNTASGTANSQASGTASFNVKALSCPDSCLPIEEIYGRVSGRTNVESMNGELPKNTNARIPAKGIASGDAKIFAGSGADYEHGDFVSGSIADQYINIRAERRDIKGTSTISGLSDGQALAGSWSGPGPVNFKKIPGKNENAFSQTKGTIRGSADAYAAKDLASVYSNLHSNADLENNSSYNADGKAVSSIGGFRSDANASNTPLKASAVIRNAIFSSASRYNSGATGFASESGGINLMKNRVTVKNVWVGSNEAQLLLEGKYDKFSGLYTADINDHISNSGPMTSDKADLSSVTEKVVGMNAHVQDDAKVAAVRIDSKNIISVMDGSMTTPGGKHTVIISSPSFVGNGSVTGPNIIIYPITDYLTVDYDAEASA